MGIEDRIKESRKNAGLTQPQLAEVLGVSHRTVTTYEKDASKITVKMTQKIASECGVNEIWLITGQGEMETSTQTQRLEAGKKLIIEHQEITNQFKDPDRGLRINQRMIRIQNAKESLLDRLESYLDGLEAAAEDFLEDAKKKNPKTSSTKRQADGK